MTPASSHTPGPWMDGGEFSNSQNEITAADGRAVAIVWTRTGPKLHGGPRPCFKDDPKLMANARLIAAAPELLESLQSSLEWLESIESEEPQDFDNHGLKNIIATAKAAISKATTP